jgi:hypothetical protein
MVTYKYYADEQGNQLIEDPAVGGLFDHNLTATD